MEDDLKFLKTKRRPKFLENGRRPTFFYEIEDNLHFFMRLKKTPIFVVNGRRPKIYKGMLLAETFNIKTRVVAPLRVT
jgi:hypothetical protein